MIISESKQKKKIIIILMLCLLIGLYAISGSVFKFMGSFLIYDDPSGRSDATVVLNTGFEYIFNSSDN